MSTLDEQIAQLQSPRFPLRDSLPALSAKPGLYAIHGSRDAWAELGLAIPSRTSRSTSARLRTAWSQGT